LASGNLTVTGTATIKDGNNSVFMEGRTDGGAVAGTSAANISVIDGVYATNSIAGARIAFAHQGSAGQRGGLTFASKNTDDNSNQPTVQGVLTPAGNWGFGTTNPTSTVSVTGDLSVSEDVKLVFNGSRPTAWDTNSYVWSKSGTAAGLHLDGYRVILSSGASEVVTLEADISNNVNVPNGNLQVEAFSASGASNGIQLGSGQCVSSRSITTNAAHSTFYNPNGLVGSIATSSTTTSFNTSSDPRLKSEFTPITGASEMILEARDQGLIGEFHFLSDPDHTVWGYNAHKLIDAQPNFGGVEGEGSRDAPLGDDVTPAGVDQSKRVPILEAAIGELLDRITALENA
jgi:hypothetical protein